MNIVFSSPAFFKYEKSILKEFESAGHSVIWINDRYGLTFVAAALLRLNIFSDLIRHRVERQVVNVLNGLSEVDIFVCISPEGLGEGVIEGITSKSKVSILYMWDSLKNKPFGNSLFKYFDCVKSFDHADCDLYNLEYLPLYFTRDYRDSRSDRSTRILVHCSLHSDRLKKVELLLKEGFDLNVTFYVKNYYLLIYRILTREFKLSWLRSVTTKPLSHSCLNEIYNAHQVVLDLSHPSQTGMTNRTWEVLASGARLITTNLYIKCDINSAPNYKVFILDFTLNYVDDMRKWLKMNPEEVDLKLDSYSIENWINRLIAC